MSYFYDPPPSTNASSSSSSSSTSMMTPLTERQESRLVLYLDHQLLLLSQAFESRTSPHSAHPTLVSYLGAVTTLFTHFILTIPPIDPSHQLRIAYALTLTGLLSPAIKAYPIRSDSLSSLWTTLRCFDQGWVKILLHQSAGGGRGGEGGKRGAGGGGKTSWTFRARLSSLIGEIRRATAMALGDPSYETERKRAYDPRGEIVKPRRWEGEERKALKEVGLGEMDQEDQDQEEQARADDDDDEIKREDVKMENGEAQGGDQDDDDDEDEDEDEDGFEEVDVMDSQTIAEDDDKAKAFEIHFKSPPPPTFIEESKSEIKATSKGFDPDAEYGDPDDEEEDDRTTEQEIAGIFEKTLKVLTEMAQEGSALVL